LFAIEKPESIIFMNDDNFLEEKDLSMALRLPQEYFVVAHDKSGNSFHSNKAGESTILSSRLLVSDSDTTMP
jgi:hypothetical protein